MVTYGLQGQYGHIISRICLSDHAYGIKSGKYADKDNDASSGDDIGWIRDSQATIISYFFPHQQNDDRTGR